FSPPRAEGKGASTSVASTRHATSLWLINSSALGPVKRAPATPARPPFASDSISFIPRGKEERRLTDPARIGLLACRLPYAPVVFAGVADERCHDAWLHRPRWRVREKDPALRQLLVTEPADHGSGLGRAFPMERERLLPGAAGKILRVLGVPLV